MLKDNDILDALNEKKKKIQKNVGKAIRDTNVPVLAQYIGILLVVLIIAVALGVGVLALVWKVLGTLLGKVFAVPLFLLIFGLAVTEQRKPRTGGREIDPEQVYEYVLNALFLVIRAVSEYSNIIMPSRPSAIELTDEPYTIEDGYVVYHFLAKTCGPIDTAQLRRDMTRTIRQMHQAHEFNGIPRDLVQINGAWYCPLQILGKPQDLGEYVQVSVVFATEKTVELTRAQKLLNLDNIGHAHKRQGKNLTDDEL